MSGLLTRLDTQMPDFDEQFSRRTVWEEQREVSVEATVAEIVADIRRRGDQALVEHTNKFDQRSVISVKELVLGRDHMAKALESCSEAQLNALREAAERVEEYHQHQLSQSWNYRDAQGNLLGQQVTAIQRVGIYVPGGKASYPSSVLMNAIPARVAGVESLVMVTPMPKGEINPMVLAAAHIAGVDAIYTIGGAQAVAALAYGTNTVPAVDKIVGPGNAYVAAAKRQVFGRVGIDMIAGPSEILVIADGSVSCDWIAMDLLSQAEHDEAAQSILICPDTGYIDDVEAAIEKALPTLEREAIARASLANRGLLIRVRDLDQAVLIANQLAPEHLQLSVENAEAWLPRIRNAGAIFLGRFSPEAIGDYCAGPNHVLPTSATARFSSPLGVYDFQKRSSIIGCSESGGDYLGRIAAVLARGESLTAHARSAEFRIKDH